MTIETLVFINLILIISILTGALLLLSVLYVKTRKKFKTLKTEEEQLKEQGHEKAFEILEEARDKALKIIASSESFENISKDMLYEKLNTVSANHLKTFQKAASELLTRYQNELEGLKETDIKIVKDISKDIESATFTELRDFREILKKETFSSQKIVEEKIEEKYAVLNKEIEEYKKESIKKIDSKIYEIIQEVAKLVIGKAVSLKGQEDLVIDSLNKTKQQRMMQ